MQEEKRFFRTVCTLAIPAALQSLLQSSFSLVDQIMIGQLGAVSVAAVGLAGKFASIYAVVIAAIGAVAGIMISQYLGQNAPAEVRRSFFTNLWLGFGLAGAFTVLCLLCPGAIMRAGRTSQPVRAQSQRLSQSAAESRSSAAATARQP
mgnify:CR=1 FL=1